MYAAEHPFSVYNKFMMNNNEKKKETMDEETDEMSVTRVLERLTDASYDTETEKSDAPKQEDPLFTETSVIEKLTDPKADERKEKQPKSVRTLQQYKLQDHE